MSDDIAVDVEPVRRSAEELATSASPLVDAVRFSRNFWFKSSDDGWRNAYAWTPPEGTPIKASVILFHGMGEHALRYQPVGEAWAKEGFAVYALDHAGHGENPCNKGFFGLRKVSISAMVDDAVAFARHISTEVHPGTPFYLMGHSMGGLIAAQAGLRTQEWEGFKGIVFSAPALRLAGQGLVPRHSVYVPFWANVACFLDAVSAGYWCADRQRLD